MLLERESPLSTRSSTGWRLTALATSAAIVTVATLLVGAGSAPDEGNAPAQARNSPPTHVDGALRPVQQERLPTAASLPREAQLSRRAVVAIPQ